jgi:hypothetical protein
MGGDQVQGSSSILGLGELIMMIKAEERWPSLWWSSCRKSRTRPMGFLFSHHPGDVSFLKLWRWDPDYRGKYRAWGRSKRLSYIYHLGGSLAVQSKQEGKRWPHGRCVAEHSSGCHG